MDQGAFFVALSGVGRGALSDAARAVLRGNLGHGFFPSPPELRMLCDKLVSERHQAEQREVARKAQQDEWQSLQRAHAAKTPEAKARVENAYQRFLDSYESPSERQAREESENVRKRYGITDEAVAKLKDRPVSRAER